MRYVYNRGADAVQGPPGTGKTTSVLCLALALSGGMYWEGCMELNPSVWHWST